MYTEALQLKVKKLSREELERLAVNALFHLRSVSHSRNSFDPEYLEKLHAAGVGMPLRSAPVENMHQHAAMFLRQNDV